MPEPRAKKFTVILAGLGNIGSHVVPLLARDASLRRVVLIDSDTYDETNLATQDIEPRDVGKAKAHVQARRLRRLNPKLKVDAIARPIQCVPLQRLKGDAI